MGVANNYTCYYRQLSGAFYTSSTTTCLCAFTPVQLGTFLIFLGKNFTMVWVRFFLIPINTSQEVYNYYKTDRQTDQ